MATIVNDKDKILQGAAVRLPATSGLGIFFTNPAPIFKIADDIATPTSHTLTVRFLGQLTGTVTWSVVSGTITSTAGQSGNTWTIQATQLTTDNAVVRASLAYLGVTYTADIFISKISDGEAGLTGDEGLTARIAYQLVAQNLPTPTYSSTTTGGTSLPGVDWLATVPAAAVGSVIWYIYGRYNPNADTYNGVPGNTTVWSAPIAASVFQDIRSDNWNGGTPPVLGTPSSHGSLGYYIQRTTGNAYFNTVVARGSLITGTAGQQRIEINSGSSNRINAFSNLNSRFLSIGGSGGTTPDGAVIGISGNSNVTNPIWIESAASVGSGILSNTQSTANAFSSISTGNGRLFYGSITNGSNPDSAIRIDVDSAGHSNSGISIYMGGSTGSAFVAGGSGDGYAFDAVSRTTGAPGSKSGIGYFRGIDFPTTSSTIVTPGTQAQLVVNVLNITTSGAITFSITLESTNYTFVLEYNSETLDTLAKFVSAISTNINSTWNVSSSGTLANATFTLKKPTVGPVSGTNTIVVKGVTGTFTNGTSTTYSSSPTVVRLTPFPNDTSKVLRGDGTWGTLGESGGSQESRYNVKNYGALGNGVDNDYAAIQEAIDEASITGGTVYFPRGVYNINTALSYTAGAGGDPAARVHFAGDGIGASIIRQTASGNGLRLAGYTGEGPNPNLYTHITDIGFVGNGSSTGQGLSVTGGAYVYVESCHFTGWGYGFYGSNFLSSTFVACSFRFNQRGFLIERIVAAFSSSPNALTFINCQIGLNSLFGGWILGAGVFTMQGGAIEGNGTTTASSSNWGLRISEPSGSTAIESAVGISIDGVYFEANRGIADLWITSSFAKPGVTNNINGSSFARVGSSNYVTNNILLDSISEAGFNCVISGCGFKGLGGYSANASRKTIVNNNNKVQLVGCSFDNSLDAYVPLDTNVFESGIRTSSITNLNGESFAHTSLPVALGTAATGVSDAFARGDHVHPFSVITAAAASTSSISYNASTGALTYTPATGSGTVNSATQYQIGIYNTTGSAISGSNILTMDSGNDSLYLNKAGATDLRLAYNLPGVTAPGMTTTGVALGIASGFNNSTGAYSAGVIITNTIDSTPSFSGRNSAGTTKMNLGNSTNQWGKFYWGTATTGILPPDGTTTTFLRRDGTWATPATGTVTSVSGTGSGLGFTLSGTVTTSGSITLATPTVAQLKTTLGLGNLAYVSSLTSFTELNSTALADNVSATGDRILVTQDGARSWATTTQVRNALATGTPSSSNFLRGDGTWATPATGSGTVTSVSGTGSGLGFSLSGTVTTSGSITLATPTVAQLKTTLGLGNLAYVSSLTSFTELNSTALADNVSATGDRILVTQDGARSWATTTQVRNALATGTPSSSNFLRGDGTWATPATGGTGTVTSVSGTGSAGGLSLSGTVTTSGSITLSGTLNLTGATGTAANATNSSQLGGIAASNWARIFTGNSGVGANAAGSGIFMNCAITGQTFNASGNTVALQASSDRRLKEKIVPEEYGLNFINDLIPVTYHLIGQSRRHHGFIAQDVAPLIEYSDDALRIENEDGTLGVDYISIIAVLTKGIQELHAKVVALETKLKDI